MTGLYEQTPGTGHNLPPTEDREGKWERWSKKRVFVRQLEGTYSDVYKSLLEQPRVYSSRHHPWKGGPVDRNPYRVLRAWCLRPEARPS
jgi:hypothetical protein